MTKIRDDLNPSRTPRLGSFLCSYLSQSRLLFEAFYTVLMIFMKIIKFIFNPNQNSQNIINISIRTPGKFANKLQILFYSIEPLFDVPLYSIKSVRHWLQCNLEKLLHLRRRYWTFIVRHGLLKVRRSY